MFLTLDELTVLTGKERHAAQVRALRLMGIEHRQRPDGSVAVLRAHVEQVFGISVSSLRPRKLGPDCSKVS